MQQSKQGEPQEAQHVNCVKALMVAPPKPVNRGHPQCQAKDPGDGASQVVDGLQVTKISELLPSTATTANRLSSDYLAVLTAC